MWWWFGHMERKKEVEYVKKKYEWNSTLGGE